MINDTFPVVSVLSLRSWTPSSKRFTCSARAMPLFVWRTTPTATSLPMTLPEGTSIVISVGRVGIVAFGRVSAFGAWPTGCGR